MEVKHNQDQLKISISNLVNVSDKILQFCRANAELNQIQHLETLIKELTKYKSSLSLVKLSAEKLYKVHFELYFQLFQQYKETILEEPDKNGDLNDNWLRKNDIKLMIGSNFGDPKNIFIPLSAIYIYATQIYKDHYENSKYNQECTYVDQFMLYLYTIFNCFEFENQENMKLKTRIDHIKNNNLRMTPNTNTGMGNIDLGKLLEMAPGLIQQLATGIGGNPEIGEKAGQIFSDPNVKNLITQTIGGVNEEMQNSKGDFSGMLSGVMNRFQNVGFSDQLKSTINKHTNGTQKVNVPMEKLQIENTKEKEQDEEKEKE